MTQPQNGVTADRAGRTTDGSPRCFEASVTQRDGSIRSLPEPDSSGVVGVRSLGVVAVIVPPPTPRAQT